MGLGQRLEVPTSSKICVLCSLRSLSANSAILRPPGRWETPDRTSGPGVPAACFVLVNTRSSLLSCLRSQSAEGSDHLPEDLQLAAGLQSAGPRMSLPESLPYLCTRRGRPEPSSGGRDSSPVAGTVAHRCISVIFERKFYLNTTWIQFGQEGSLMG